MTLERNMTLSQVWDINPSLYRGHLCLKKTREFWVRAIAPPIAPEVKRLDVSKQLGHVANSVSLVNQRVGVPKRDDDYYN